MKNRIFLFYVVISLCCACANRTGTSKEIIENFDSVSNSLEKTGNTMALSDKEQLKRLRTLQLSDPGAWNEIEKTERVTDSVVNYIDTLRNRFSKYCGEDADGNLRKDREDKLELTTAFFLTEKRGEELHSQMDRYARALADVSIPDSAALVLQSFGKAPSGRDFSATWFNSPPIAAMTILSKFKNDALYIRSIIFNEYSKLISSKQ